MDMRTWMPRYLEAVRAAFGPRVVFVGLQGSRGRGEAGPGSDIDVVLILDRLDASDLERCRAAVADLPHREALCGFVSGREELCCWERSELLSFYYDTRPCYGSLEFLLPLLGPEAARRAVLTGACSLYHACAHNLLHERSPELLPELRKSAFFTLRVRHFLDTGRFVLRRDELLPALSGRERRLLDADGDFFEQSDRLLSWASETIRAFGSSQ